RRREFPAPLRYQVALRPCDRLLEAVAEIGACGETEVVAGTGRVKHSPRLPIRLRRIPANLATVFGEVDDQSREVADRDLEAGADVHRFGTIVKLGAKDDRLGGVVDVNELARGGAAPPDVDRRCVDKACFQALAHEGRDDV